MPVRIGFTNGNVRNFADASAAYRRGSLFILAAGDTETAKFDAQDVLFGCVYDANNNLVRFIEVARVARRSTREHRGELVANAHQYGDSDLFGYDFINDGPRTSRLFPSLREAQDAADEEAAQRGHECDAACSPWVPAN